MISIDIPLQNVIFNPIEKTNWEQLSEEEILLQLAQVYQFLPPPVVITLEDEFAHIQSPFESRERLQAEKLFDRATRAANRGQYPQAIKLYKQHLNLMPGNFDARRNLGMSYLESGDVAAAEQHILEAYHLNPQDAYTLLLLGNIYFAHKSDLETGDFFYQKAILADPADAYILSNYATLLARREQYEEAIAHYEKAIAADSLYPNAYFGLANIHYKRGNFTNAYAILQEFFKQPESSDIRSEPVYATARDLYAQINHDMAQSNQQFAMNHVKNWCKELEESGGIEIEFVEDSAIETQAVAQIAWHGRNRRSHVIRYKPTNPIILPHLLAHELQHIVLESQNRGAGRNRFFATTNTNLENAMRSISAEIHKMRRKGHHGSRLDAFIDYIIRGMANQLFNAPLDMIIEHLLYHEHHSLHPNQFASLKYTNEQNAQSLNNSEIKKLTPRLIFNANAALNAAYALFTDYLQTGTNYADVYEGTQHMRTGRQLFSRWLEMIEDYQPGDEFRLVDQFASILKLEDWYDWLEDNPELSEENGGSTNPELLKQKEMASVMYCLDALKRFENMSRDEIRTIVFEIALLGRSGIDYASSEQKYNLASVPGKTFSGLQLICMMYVGFKDIDPTVDAGVDLREPYETALKLHEN